MANPLLDPNASWTQVEEHVARLKRTVMTGLREMASVRALTDSCVSEARREIGTPVLPSDVVRYVDRVATYAVALALVRHGELFEGDRAAIDAALAE